MLDGLFNLGLREFGSVRGQECIDEIVRLVNDDHTAIKRQMQCLSSITQKEQIVRQRHQLGMACAVSGAKVRAHVHILSELHEVLHILDVRQGMISVRVHFSTPHGIALCRQVGASLAFLALHELETPLIHSLRSEQCSDPTHVVMNTHLLAAAEAHAPHRLIPLAIRRSLYFVNQLHQLTMRPTCVEYLGPRLVVTYVWCTPLRLIRVHHRSYLGRQERILGVMVVVHEKLVVRQGIFFAPCALLGGGHMRSSTACALQSFTKFCLVRFDGFALLGLLVCQDPLRLRILAIDSGCRPLSPYVSLSMHTEPREGTAKQTQRFACARGTLEYAYLTMLHGLEYSRHEVQLDTVCRLIRKLEGPRSHCIVLTSIMTWNGQD